MQSITSVTLKGCSYANLPETVPPWTIKEPRIIIRTLGFRTWARCRRPR